MVSVWTSRPWGGWLCLGYHVCFLRTWTLLSPPDYTALLLSGFRLSLDKYNYALDRNKSKHNHAIGSATVTCEKDTDDTDDRHSHISVNGDSSLKMGHFYCNEMGQLWLLRLEWAFHCPILLLCHGCYENTDLKWLATYRNEWQNKEQFLRVIIMNFHFPQYVRFNLSFDSIDTA